MTKASREEIELARWREEMLADQSTMVVGAKVYRARWDRVEEGFIRRVEPAHVHESPIPARKYVAEFPQPPLAQGAWEDQHYQCKFFTDRARAVKALVREMRDRAEKLERDAAKWREEAKRWEMGDDAYEAAKRLGG